eukprot:TRINITY_DN3163_c0_g1_i1.p3 TRINITY_DN3163_c0_g1~~TRINITY_DN3163_c0_g1_i1.p3  ORF type:complete len:229 (-),score=68.40 TRINITY_DN3163_c0_g1_i1:119-805(-)
MPLFLMMAAISAVNVVGFSAAAIAFTGADLSLSDVGAFGWLRAERLGYGVYLGVVIGLLGAVTAIAALKYLPAVTVGVAQQLMPIVGTALAVGLGVAAPPDTMSAVGGLVLLGGTLLVADATRKREMSFNISDQHVRLVSVPPTPAGGVGGPSGGVGGCPRPLRCRRRGWRARPSGGGGGARLRAWGSTVPPGAGGVAWGGAGWCGCGGEGGSLAVAEDECTTTTRAG